MKSSDRRAKEMEQVRGRILDAARELFVRHGYDAVSMRKIGQAIGYTAAGLYTHFADKEALMRELCRQDFGGLGQAVAKLRRVADPIDRIAKFGHAYVRFAMEHPNQYRLMFMTPKPPGVVCEMEEDEAAAPESDPDADGYEAFSEAVQEAWRAGAFRPELKDAELITQVFWAGVHGIASLEITHGESDCIEWRSLKQRTETMIDSLLRGMLTPAADREYRA